MICVDLGALSVSPFGLHIAGMSTMSESCITSSKLHCTAPLHSQGGVFPTVNS
jgi:hypothetical protein